MTFRYKLLAAGAADAEKGAASEEVKQSAEAAEEKAAEKKMLTEVHPAAAHPGLSY
jgi:hypothetical protein